MPLSVLCSAFQLRVVTLGADSSGSSGSDEEGPAAGTLPVDADDDNPQATFEQQVGVEPDPTPRRTSLLARFVAWASSRAARPEAWPPAELARCGCLGRLDAAVKFGATCSLPAAPAYPWACRQRAGLPDAGAGAQLPRPTRDRFAGPGSASQGQEPRGKRVRADVQPAACQRHGRGGRPKGASPGVGWVGWARGRTERRRRGPRGGAGRAWSSRPLAAACHAGVCTLGAPLLGTVTRKCVLTVPPARPRADPGGGGAGRAADPLLHVGCGCHPGLRADQHNGCGRRTHNDGEGRQVSLGMAGDAQLSRISAPRGGPPNGLLPCCSWWTPAGGWQERGHAGAGGAALCGHAGRLLGG